MRFQNLAVTSLLFSPLTIASASGSSVLDLIPSNFDKIVFQSSKPALVEFFAPWCGHCKNLAPVYEELGAAFSHAEDKVSIGKVDADEHKSLGKQFGVQGFPTLKWFDGKKGSKPEDYNGGRDLESLTKFVAEKTGVKPRSKKATPSAVEMLTDKTFESEVGGDKDVLVAFTAPWCGRMSTSATSHVPSMMFQLNLMIVLTTLLFLDCKTLAPIWEQVATDFAAESTVLIAKVDAEAENSKATAQAQEVSSYPTIKFFPRGSTTPEKYEGARSEDALVAFMNEKAGTHRVVGGGLDTKAGTIEAVDSVLAKYITGGGLRNIEKATSDVNKAVQGLRDKYAEYYVKALKKLGQNPEYASKEQTRLAGLLKKGGLAQEKIDDLTRRSNILRSFLVKDEGKSEL
jgi:protein disulfide-isomerase A6